MEAVEEATEVATEVAVEVATEVVREVVPHQVQVPTHMVEEVPVHQSQHPVVQNGHHHHHSNPIQFNHSLVKYQVDMIKDNHSNHSQLDHSLIKDQVHTVKDLNLFLQRVYPATASRAAVSPLRFRHRDNSLISREPSDNCPFRTLKHRMGAHHNREAATSSSQTCLSFLILSLMDDR